MVHVRDYPDESTSAPWPTPAVRLIIELLWDQVCFGSLSDNDGTRLEIDPSEYSR